jgi:hypothetical protein
MKELTHFIGGKHANGTSVRFCDGFEPMTGEVISRVPLTSKAEVRAAVENAIAAQATVSVDRRHDQIHPPLPISTERRHDFIMWRPTTAHFLTHSSSRELARNCQSRSAQPHAEDSLLAPPGNAALR